MSKVGRAVGGFFDGMFGGGDEGDSSFNRLEDQELKQKQSELERQQKAEMAEEKKRLERQRISMLRGRFSTPGGAGGQDMGAGDAAAASLFSRITGRVD